MKKLHLLALVSLTAFLFSGCASLSPDGPYKGDEYLYRSQETIVNAHKTLHAFLKVEHDNHAMLKKYPEVGKYADFIRDNEPRWIGSAKALVAAYKANPSAENKTALDATTDILAAAISQAAQYISMAQDNQ